MALQVFSDVGSPEVALDGITLLELLGGPEGGSAAAWACRNIVGRLDRWSYRKEDVKCTATFAAKAGPVGIYVQHGTDNPAQYTPQVHQFIDDRALFLGGDQSQPDPVYVKASAEAAMATIVESRCFEAETCYCFGHSQGHGIQLNVLYTLPGQPIATAPRAKIVSFGGNAVANVNKRNFLTNTPQVRWMNSEDPIPTLPWWFLMGATGAGFVNVPVLQFIRAIVHCGQGRDLHRDGTYQEGPLPTGGILPPPLNIVAWLQSFEEQRDNFHSLAEYRRRITLLQATPAGGGGPWVGGADDDTPSFPPVSLPTMNNSAQSRAAVQTVIERSVAAAHVPVVQPPPIAPGLSFHARKVNGLWFVVRGTMVVQQMDGKRAARSLARHLNRIERETDAIGGPALLAQVAELIS